MLPLTMSIPFTTKSWRQVAFTSNGFGNRTLPRNVQFSRLWLKKEEKKVTTFPWRILKTSATIMGYSVSIKLWNKPYGNWFGQILSRRLQKEAALEYQLDLHGGGCVRLNHCAK